MRRTQDTYYFRGMEGHKDGMPNSMSPHFSLKAGDNKKEGKHQLLNMFTIIGIPT